MKRSALVRRWKIAACAMSAGILTVLGFLFFRSPLLVNPWQVASGLKAGTIATPTLMLMAALLPVVFLSCFVLLAALVLFQFAAMANERRLLGIIGKLADGTRLDRLGM